VFYQEVLGFRIIHESVEGGVRYASFARDGKILLTLWEQNSKRLKRHRPGLHHVAFEAASLEEMNRTRGLLDNLGLRWSANAFSCSHRPTLDVIYFEDPDGIRIEVYCAAQASYQREADAA
jgi:lactoylglutathione lyase